MLGPIVALLLILVVTAMVIAEMVVDNRKHGSDRREALRKIKATFEEVPAEDVESFLDRTHIAETLRKEARLLIEVLAAITNTRAEQLVARGSVERPFTVAITRGTRQTDASPFLGGFHHVIACEITNRELGRSRGALEVPEESIWDLLADGSLEEIVRTTTPYVDAEESAVVA